MADRALIIGVYEALCKSLLTYCITSWGGACGTHMLRLERAQRALLKVATCRPITFPTTDLYRDCEVLTVRQLYIQYLIVAQCKLITPKEKANVIMRRRKDRVFTLPKCNTKLAKQQQPFLGPFIFNIACKTLANLVPLTARDVKREVNKWLKSLNYDETENILKVIY